MSFEDEFCIPWSPLPQGTLENIGAKLDFESARLPRTLGAKENIEDLESPLISKLHKLSIVQKPNPDKKPLYITIIILLICIPSLIGACCWSILMGRLIGGTTSTVDHKLAHQIYLAITFTFVILVNCFIFRNRKSRCRSKGFCHYWGPFILTICCAPLIMADLTRHVLQDTGIWKECDRQDDVVWDSSCLWASNQYRCSELPEHGCVPRSHETISHLSPIGVMFSICFTNVGVVLLFFGVLWNANILKKF